MKPLVFACKAACVTRLKMDLSSGVSDVDLA